MENNEFIRTTSGVIFNDTAISISNRLDDYTEKKVFQEFEAVATDSFEQLAIENRTLLSKFNRQNKIQNRINWANRKKSNTKQYRR